VFVGVELGTWLNYQIGYLNDNNVTLPLEYGINSYNSIFFRTIVGLAIAGLTEFIGKLVVYDSLCLYFKKDKQILKETANSVDNTEKNFIDLSTKFVTYAVLGVNVVFFVPLIYKFLNIQRDSFYTEI
jgi:hypothetical protein